MILLRLIPRLTVLVVFAAVIALVSQRVIADDSVVSPLPLHAQIDRLISAGWQKSGIVPAQHSSDAEFLRRVSLDLTGVIPTSSEARSFLDDRSAGKRTRFIDRLLASPEYALHMSRVFDIMLTERRIATIKSYDVPTAKWREYLVEAFAENRPWDRIVREILSSDGTDTLHGSAAKFFLVRDTKPDLLTRDIGRLFLGTDLQCAQCHDDPRIDDYKQADYYGIYAFLNRLTHFRDDKNKRSLVAEKAEGDVTFTSVFTGKKGETYPQLPGSIMIDDPKLTKGSEYLVAPAKDKRAVPSYSRRFQLARFLPERETIGFSRNIVNRLWAHMLSRGLVHPLDLHHQENPPSHPELLDLLAQRFEEMNFDISQFFREIAISETYQRSSILPDGPNEIPPASFAVASLRGLSPEQLAWCVLQATGHLEIRLKQEDSRLKQHDPKFHHLFKDHWSWKKKVYDRLQRDADTFVAVFSGLPGQPDGDFQPAVDQALFFVNGEKILGLLNAGGDTLVERLSKFSTSEEMIEELYLSIFNRYPEPEEIVEITNQMKRTSKPDDRRVTIRQLVWGMLLSAEFRLNH